MKKSKECDRTGDPRELHTRRRAHCQAVNFKAESKAAEF
jgi:hypothetical protein